MPKQPPNSPKLQSLRQQGTLHPRPQTVTDELFAASEFFDPHDLVQVKYEMLRRVEKDARPITEAAANFGFSRPSFYQAQAAFQAGGLAALVPLKRGPKEAHKLTAEVMEFIRQTRQGDPSVRAADLASQIKQRFDLVVHPRTIERGLARSQKKRRKPGGVPPPGKTRG
jgi:transposase